MKRLWFVSLLFVSTVASAQTASVQYLANEGLMVTHRDAKVLFDPLYGNGFDQYALVPDEVRAAIFAGDPPYDGVDAVFISHHHGDHFSAEDMLRLLAAQPGVKLYAPMQAVTAVSALLDDGNAGVREQMIGLDLDYGDPPVKIRTDELIIDALHVPHSGWPTRMTDVQNIGFRITLNDYGTVLHLGDADPRVVHFADEDYWDERTIDVAFPPYWFFASEDGVEILESRLTIGNSIGIHVPARYADPALIPEKYRGNDLFTTPGEGRRFMGTQSPQ